MQQYKFKKSEFIRIATGFTMRQWDHLGKCVSLTLDHIISEHKAGRTMDDILALEHFLNLYQPETTKDAAVGTLIFLRQINTAIKQYIQQKTPQA